MPETRKFLIKTLGCKANLADSLELSREFAARGWQEARESEVREGNSGVSLCIVNSCTVTDEADRQSRKLASRLSRLHPEARVVVTGCAAEVDPERIAASVGIDYVIGNRDRGRLAELAIAKMESPRPSRGEVLGVACGYSEMASRHAHDREWPLLGNGAGGVLGHEWGHEAGVSGDEGRFLAGGMGHVSHTRSFLKIQEGCNAFCTYCIIPYGRGPSRSLEPLAFVERVRSLCAGGTRELVLTGTNIGDYGTDLGDGFSLEGLIERILGETSLERLRLSSLDPVEITPGILRLIEREPRVCPHFHVSLQSPRDRVLKLMKRKYSAAQAEACLESIAALNPPGGRAFVGMDLITGFPGETDAEFEAGFALLERWPWTRLHVFPYSERAGTPATRLPHAVPAAIRAERARRLLKLSLNRVTAHYERALRESAGAPFKNVLLERADRAGWVHGFTPSYLRLRVPGGGQPLRNRIASVLPSSLLVEAEAGEACLVGQIASG